MSIRSRLDSVRPTLVFSDPHTTDDGTTIVGVSSVRADGSATAVGMFVVSGGQCTWSPVVDRTRIAIFGISVGLVAATFSALAVLRRPPWPDLTGTVDLSR
ncbi:hypothetical protein [Rhodococcoides kyotonense]|uniref:Uncharacterized protein n=1 Tax=Rhodococcoides kyotonense TaxID=398843 RepID=A0A239KJV4_9NOCA|nr:hypothetical protein [Rhodococcus kyotonensis]SNT17454.1 hypothetical protein SAMN05421642_110172 [Rhodococcus kyotonensis]